MTRSSIVTGFLKKKLGKGRTYYKKSDTTRSCFSDKYQENPESQAYRLPSIMEWCYAALGGKGKYNSNDFKNLHFHCGDFSRPLPVKDQKISKNKVNLYGFQGNVREISNEFDEGAEDHMILLGGYFGDNSSDCDYSKNPPKLSYANIDPQPIYAGMDRFGFRVYATIDE